MALVGYSNGEKIYNFLISKGFTPEGACAVLGSLDAESGLRSNNLENTKESALGSDTYYTSAVNNGTYTKTQFANDRAGYGIAQWTWHTRKQKLYEATVEKGLSIADLEGQCEFLVTEIKGYTALNELLRTTKDIDAASDMFLKNFEAPVVCNYADRRRRSRTYYNKYGKNYTPPVTKEENPPKKEETSKVESSTTLNKTYKVLPGDSWWQIAEKTLNSGIRMNELASLNGKTIRDIIHPGQILKLPDDAEIEIDVDKPSNNMPYFEYVVKPGEGWWQVAVNTLNDGNKMYEIAAYNKKSVVSMLHPNMKLKIPYSTSNTQEYTLHTVKKNETWRTIADAYLGDWRKMGYLAKYNGKNTNNILNAGMVIKIPKK